jgi:hypothetical protein
MPEAARRPEPPQYLGLCLDSLELLDERFDF